MKLSIFILLLACFSFSVGYAQKKTTTPAVAEPVEGVVYVLPQTGIRVHVKATRERFVAGPFNSYAQRMLGINDAPSESKDRWNLDDIKIELFSEPDPEQVYKAMGPMAHLVSLTETGVLAGINTSGKTSETKVETQSFLTKDLEKQVKFTDLSIWSFYSPTDSTKSFRMVSKNMDQKAAEAAETIFNLRNSRFALLTNADDEPLPDGKSFEVMTKELGKMEENYLALFIGKSSKQSYDFSFTFVPGSKTVKGEVFFRFSEDKGVLPKSDLSGRPIVIEVNKAEGLAMKQGGLVSSENPNAGKSGLYYRMPGMADVRILDGSTQLAGARIPLAQFGAIAPLPEDLLQGNHQIEIFPNSGAIKSIKAIFPVEDDSKSDKK
jgi:hypothetical protein